VWPTLGSVCVHVCGCAHTHTHTHTHPNIPAMGGKAQDCTSELLCVMAVACAFVGAQGDLYSCARGPLPSSLPAFEPAFRLDSQLFGFPLTVFFQTVSRACFLTLPELHGKPLRFAFKVTSATCFPGPLTVVALLTQRFTHWHCTLLLKEFQGPSRAN